ncbi:MAG: peptide chain release factor N(5)-glutamine methyltransferase [Xanthomonadales bacterium]|nr:peptide chain release factor N(5)-glutamine methyltransferase [Xanthomonadales bacterium]MDL1870378.1 peptide chain release factor N(5)-glutamine methyltransferase [Gammaproteobacteria bacterium PRO6]
MAGAPANVRALLAAASLRLDGDAARSEVELLLAHALGTSRSWLYAWPEHVPTPAQQARFAELVEARVRGEPVAYLLGEREFWSLRLVVTPAVLIPRADTEVLVEQALARLPAATALQVADLGTGSGAVALAIASERAQARVLATDASPAALALARRNAHDLRLANVEFAQGDWCAALGSRQFDLIASNPPYIAEGDPHLLQGDLRFEPRAALGSGPDGLDAIRAIVAQAPRHLLADGWLLLEHGFDQATAVRALLADAGYREIGSARDHAGHERVSGARRPRA